MKYKNVFGIVGWKNSGKTALVESLVKFITEQGKIIPAHVTGVSSKYQRMLNREIKKARILSLLPFVVDPRLN